MNNVIHEYKDAETQRRRDAETQRHKYTDTQIEREDKRVNTRREKTREADMDKEID